MPRNSGEGVQRPLSRAETQAPANNVTVEEAQGGWPRAVQVAIVGIFLLALIAAFYFARAILMPVLAALIIGLTLAPLERRAEQHRVPQWLFATLIVGLVIAALHIATLLLSGPISNWIGRLPELTSIVKGKLQTIDLKLTSFQNLFSAGIPASGDTGFKFDIAGFAASAVEILSPAIGQLIIFFAMLFFILVEQKDLRRQLVLAFPGTDARLSAIRILNDVEENLAGYIATVSVINFAIGIIVAIGVYLIGIPNAALWGVVAFFCNYLPYVGPAIVLCILFAVGLINFASISYALIAPAFYLTLTTLEGHFITPNILGRRFMLNPLAVFVALIFWTWLWGPIGTFLSVPILIIFLSVLEHLVLERDAELPG
jgi:predicted PurR-regulated permease PerM